MRAVPTPDLLHALLVAPGPSGHEDAPARVWREAASSFADVTSDTLGSSFARVAASGAGGAPTLAIVGHIDEIGIAVTNIEDNGLLSFATIGGISPEMLLGQRFELLTRNGPVLGVVGRRRVKVQQQRDRVCVEHADLHLDIGAKDRADAESLVRPGDVAVWTGAPVELPNGRLVSRALDNRLGAYIALDSARRVAEAGGAELDVVAVAAVQEEVGLYGARVAGFGLDPRVALAADVTPATDYPGGDASLAGRAELGGGALIARGPTLNRQVVDGLVAVAEREGIAHGFEICTRGTSTDADELHLARAGVPTGLVSIPLRYVHSPTELCDLADVEAVVQLITAYALSLSRDESFAR
jgi:putative aminopeptidase FrvX